MTLLETLQSHKGSLLRIKTQLFWYGSQGWDKNPGRICLILDATRGGAFTPRLDAAAGAAAAAAAANLAELDGDGSIDAALLLIDGSLRWVWVVEGDVEVVDETR